MSNSNSISGYSTNGQMFFKNHEETQGAEAHWMPSAKTVALFAIPAIIGGAAAFAVTLGLGGANPLQMLEMTAFGAAGGLLAGGFIKLVAMKCCGEDDSYENLIRK